MTKTKAESPNLSTAQAEEQIDKILAEVDTNQDGKVSKEEWLAFHEKMCL